MLRFALAAIFVLATYLVRRTVGTWLHPAALALLPLTVAMVGTLMLTDFTVTVTATFLVLAAVGVFGAAACVAETRATPARPRSAAHPQWVRLSVVVGILAALSTAALTAAGVIGVGDTAVDQLVSVGAEVSASRYAGQAAAHPLLGPLLGLNFLGVLLAPLLLRTAGRFDRALALTAPAAVLPTAVVSTGRASLVFNLALWTATHLACRIHERRLYFRVGRSLAVSSIVALVGSALFLALGIIRYGGLSIVAIDRSLRGLRLYAFGEIPALSAWFADRPPGELRLGEITFNGITSLFTGKQLDQGVYSVTYEIDAFGTTTNVFTAYRGIIEDFSMLGMFAFLAVIGGLAGWLYRSALQSPRHAALLAPISTFLLLQWVVSPYTYTSAALAAVGFVALHTMPVTSRPFITHHRRRRRRRRKFRLVSASTDGKRGR